jgi:pyroglutamyl-peptidase
VSSLPTILLTGFEPFGGSPVNPSQQIVEALAADPSPGLVFRTALLPVDVRLVPDAIRDAIVAARPSAVVMLGQAGRRPAVAVERVAINVLDFRIPDNSGRQPEDEPIVPGGPAAYFATLPLKKIVQAIREAGVPAVVSNSAGTYLCNQVLYVALHHIARENLNIPAGFIHVPSLPEQVLKTPNASSMALSAALIAIRAALETLAIHYRTVFYHE